MGNRWLSKPAVLWVLYDAGDVPAHLLSTLIVYAVHAGTDGRGAHPSAATVAMLTRKSERNAKKDIEQLKRLALLAPGDQRIVAHIRPDRRPAVYDLAMPRGDADYTPSDPPRGVAQDTPSNGNGVSHTTGRGVAQGPNGVSHTTPKEVLKRTGKRGRAAGADAPPPAAEPETRRCAFCRSDDHEHCYDSEEIRPPWSCGCWCGGRGTCPQCAAGEHGNCLSRSECGCQDCSSRFTTCQCDGGDCEECPRLNPDGTWCMCPCHDGEREYWQDGRPPGTVRTSGALDGTP